MEAHKRTKVGWLVNFDRHWNLIIGIELLDDPNVDAVYNPVGQAVTP